MVKLKKPKVVLLDIEGTLTSAKYLGEVLFPYIRNNVKQYLKSSWGNTELMVTIDRLKKQQLEDTANNLNPPLVLTEGDPDSIIQSVAANVAWQMETRKKTAALKQMQILVWVYGYEKEHIKGHVFDDVPSNLHQWKFDFGIRLYTYSTGMPTARTLLFACSTFGNLLPLFDGDFSADEGPKTDPTSFKNVQTKLGIPGPNILFITDTPREARAAVAGGCKALLVDRPENKPLAPEDRKEFPVVATFNDIIFE